MQYTKALILIICSTIGLTSCQPKGPEPIIYNKDNCAHCKMTIADPRFGAELQTLKGRIYKFDELSCLLNYSKENAAAKDAKLFVSNFEKPYELTPVENLVFIQGPELDSPMGGNVAGLLSEEMANTIAAKVSGRIISWNEITAK